MTIPVPNICAISHFNRDVLHSCSEDQTRILGERIGQRIIVSDVKFDFAKIAILGSINSGKTTLADAIFNIVAKDSKCFYGPYRKPSFKWSIGVKNNFGISLSDTNLPGDGIPPPLLTKHSCQIIEHLPQEAHSQCDGVIYFRKAGAYGRDITIYTNPNTALGKSLSSVLIPA